MQVLQNAADSLTAVVDNYHHRIDLFFQRHDIDIFLVFSNLTRFSLQYSVKFFGAGLICLASSIVSGLVYQFFHLVLPLICPVPYTLVYFMHISIVGFFVVNVLFNYYMCVITRHNSPSYDLVVRELAKATNFVYPEDEAETREFEERFKRKMNEIHMARREVVMREEDAGDAGIEDDAESGFDSKSNSPPAQSAQSNPNPPPPPEKNIPRTSTPAWLNFSPLEWSFCPRTLTPKPPRSHYDHVSKDLVLNMDHYCPWMANCVGYFNYRYFLNFLIYVFTAMLYGLSITYPLFKAAANYRARHILKSPAGQNLIQNAKIPPLFNMTMLQRHNVTFCFMLLCSIGFAVGCLMIFHLYLMLSAQTTIEFHGNLGKRTSARHRGVRWSNPYDLGWKRNCMQVYGEGAFSLKAFMVSAREPEYLPVPLAGVKGRRSEKRSGDKKVEDFGDLYVAGAGGEESADETHGLMERKGGGINHSRIPHILEV